MYICTKCGKTFTPNAERPYRGMMFLKCPECEDNPSAASAGYDGKLNQTIYEHGGSRIWIEKDGKRELIADTFTTPDFAVALFHFVSDWMNRKKS